MSPTSVVELCWGLSRCLPISGIRARRSNVGRYPAAPDEIRATARRLPHSTSRAPPRSRTLALPPQVSSSQGSCSTRPRFTHRSSTQPMILNRARNRQLGSIWADRENGLQHTHERSSDDLACPCSASVVDAVAHANLGSTRAGGRGARAARAGARQADRSRRARRRRRAGGACQQRAAAGRVRSGSVARRVPGRRRAVPARALRALARDHVRGRRRLPDRTVVCVATRPTHARGASPAAGGRHGCAGAEVQRTERRPRTPRTRAGRTAVRRMAGVSLAGARSDALGRGLGRAARARARGAGGSAAGGRAPYPPISARGPGSPLGCRSRRRHSRWGRSGTPRRAGRPGRGSGP